MPYRRKGTFVWTFFWDRRGFSLIFGAIFSFAAGTVQYLGAGSRWGPVGVKAAPTKAEVCRPLGTTVSVG